MQILKRLGLLVLVLTFARTLFPIPAIELPDDPGWGGGGGYGFSFRGVNSDPIIKGSNYTIEAIYHYPIIISSPTGGHDTSIDLGPAYFWKEGEEKSLATTDFTGRWSYEFEEVALSDSGTYFFQVDRKTYSYDLIIEPEIYLDLRWDRWLLEAERWNQPARYSPAWFPSQLIGWNYSDEDSFPWVYQKEHGWLYLIYSNQAIWFYSVNYEDWFFTSRDNSKIAASDQGHTTLRFNPAPSINDPYALLGD